MTKQKWRILATLFFCYHLLAIAVYSLPLEWHNHSFYKPFKNYIFLISHQQGYNMFIRRLVYPGVSLSLIAENKQNERQVFGPLLPGLREFGDGTMRTQKLFSRMFEKDQRVDVLMSSYAQNACREIANTTSFKPISIYLKLSAQKNNTLEEIRAGKPAFENYEKIQGPFTCG